MSIITVEQFNQLSYEIARDYNTNNFMWLNNFQIVVQRYYDKPGNAAGGNLHVILEDGNIEDVCIVWCAGYTAGANDEDGNYIAKLIERMTMAQREHALINMANVRGINYVD